MTDSAILVPHLSLPLRLGAGDTFATVEQDSDSDVMQGVLVLLSTPRGRQIELPDYGLPDQVFSDTVDTAAIVDAVEAWQPRAAVDPAAIINSMDDLIRQVQVVVSNG